MRVIANNLANIGTTGFKRDRADFATLAYQEQRVAGQASTGQTAFAVGLNLGTGVQVQGTSRINTQGTLSRTDNVFDLALDGDGFFQVELPPGGQIGFTRAGNFALSNDGTLITAQGYALQPPLQVPQVLGLVPGLAPVPWQVSQGTYTSGRKFISITRRPAPLQVSHRPPLTMTEKRPGW